jgi:putative protease
MNKRDANQGACTNACRWEYKIHEAQEDANGDVIPVQQIEPSNNAVPIKFKMT